MSRLFLVSLLAMLFNTIILGNNIAQAADNRIDEKLVKISAITDSKEALSQLADILILPQLTTKQYLSAVNLQAKRYISLDNFKQAITLLQQTKVISQDQKLYQLEADANNILGVAYYYQGNNPKALIAYQASLSFYQTNDSSLKEANLLNNIALVYSAMSSYLLAIKNYKSAELIYKSLGNEEDKVDVRYNIALMLVNLKRYDKAIEMLHQVVSQRKTMSDKLGLAMSWAHLGIAYKHSGQYLQAKSYLLNALSYFESHNKRYHVASQMQNISALYIELEDHTQAKKYAEQGIIISLAVGHQKAYAGSLNSLAKILFHQGDIKQALNTLTLSNKVARESNYKTLLNDNLALLSLIYATQNQTAEAFSAHLSYVKQKNKVENELFNAYLARFEAEQLSQQVAQLLQNQNRQKIQAQQQQQLHYGIIFTILFSLLFIFFTHRRNVGKNTEHVLDSKVKERTQELEWVMQKLQQANTIKSQLLTNMSTDIKKPLTSIIKQSELLLNKNNNNQDIDKEVEKIFGSSSHLLQLINDIIDLSKIEANTLELALKKQDLNIIITEVTALYIEQSHNKGLCFELHNALTSPFIINVDGLRLKQILNNFFSNALKFTHKGKIILSVTIFNNEFKFSIIDTGVGMNKVKLKQIFDSFDQGYTSVNRHFGSSGSGLGLFISAQLASIMGGQISAQSLLDKGTTFTFTLPIQTMNIK